METQEYQTLFDTEESHWWFRTLRMVLLDMCPKLGLGPSSKILDAGCGTGKNIAILRQEVSENTYGFDLSSVAAKYWPSRKLNKICRASVNSIPFADETFDAVFCVDVLECNGVDEKQAYNELVRVVRKGGHIILVVPAYNWLSSLEHNLAVHASSRRYSRKTVRRLVENSQGHIIRSTHLFMSLFGPIACFRLWKRLTRSFKEDNPRSELKQMPRAINELLVSILKLEGRLISVTNMPFGSSIIAVIKKCPAIETAPRSWSFLGGPGSWQYRFFDTFRKKLNRKLVLFLRKQAIMKHGSRVLEAGSGSGEASWLFGKEKMVQLSVAVDIDPEALQEARKQHPTLPVVLADLRHLPFREGVFDLVWNSSTLEHINTPGVVLDEMRHVTREGGFVFVGVPYRFGPLRFQPWIGSTRLGVWLGPIFDRLGLSQMLRERALEPELSITYFFRCFVGILARKPVHSDLETTASQVENENLAVLRMEN